MKSFSDDYMKLPLVQQQMKNAEDRRALLQMGLMANTPA